MEIHKWTDWHLTPQGWVKGSSQADIKSPPVDRLLTCRWSEITSLVNFKTDKRLVERWRSEDALIIDQLLDQFGEPPFALGGNEPCRVLEFKRSSFANSGTAL